MDLYSIETSPPLQTIQRGNVGMPVRRLQEWLGLRGAGTGIDGDFGPATEAATIQLTGRKAIEPDQWQQVCSPLIMAKSAVGSGSFGERVVQIAKAHLERSPREVGGDNKGPWVRYYCRGYEVAWCQGFASSMWLQAGDAPLDLVLDGIWCLYVPRMVNEAKAKGRFQSANSAIKIPPGSMFFLRGGAVGYSHVGIVTQDNGETIETTEGNTNDDGSANGYEVCRRVRRRSSCDFGLA